MIESESAIFEDKLGETARQLLYSNKDITVNIFNLVGDIFFWGLAIPTVFYLTRVEENTISFLSSVHKKLI